MTKKVAVSSAQKRAATAMVNRSAVTGRYVSDSVHKIANAKVQSVNGNQVPAPTPSPVRKKS
jgi:hypothetical protein